MKMFCPACEEEKEVKKITSTKVKVRGEVFDVPVNLYQCVDCGEQFDSMDNPEDELDKAYRLYRKKYGYLQPEEIKSLREKYGLTQIELAKLLGWSVATLNRYENGALQDPAHDNVLKSLKDPHFLLNLIEENPEVLDKPKRKELLKKLKRILKKERYLKEIENYVEENELWKINLKKLIEMIKFFANNCILNKTKLNKLLFYCDFLHFKKYSKPITGIQYIKLQYGPCPQNYDFILNILEQAEVIAIDRVILEANRDRFVYEEKIKSNQPVNIDIFSDGEREIMSKVLSHFGNLSATHLSELSHKEKGYIETEMKKVISYDYAQYIVFSERCS